MANICHATIKFTGDGTVLSKIKAALTKPDLPRFPNRMTLSYSLMDGLLPGIRDEEVFKIIGCDYSKYILAGHPSYDCYTKEEADLWEKKAKQFIKKNKWIDFRDVYINERIREFDITETEDSLIFQLELAWYCPLNFFIYVAKHFNIDMVAMEKVEGNYTQLAYQPTNKKNKYIFTTHDINVLVKNKDYQKATLDIALFTPSDLVFAALFKENDKLAKKLIKEFSVTEKDVLLSIASVKDEKYSIYGDSILYDPKNNQADDLNFNTTLEKLEKKLEPFF